MAFFIQDEPFRQSISIAESVAHKDHTQQGDVRWSLTGRVTHHNSSSHIGEATGPSLGAGFALVLKHLLDEEPLPIDPQLAITGAVETDGQIKSVGELEVKLKAAEDLGLGVIVPADDWERLRDHWSSRLARLEGARDVNQASEIACGLMGELVQYLTNLRTRLSELPAYLPQIDFGKIRQRVRLSEERLRYDETEARFREAQRREGMFEEDEEKKDQELSRAYKWRGAEAYEEQREGQEPRTSIVDWEETRTKLRRAVVLGDPGFGKTWLLKYEGRRIAEEQMEKLRSGELGAYDAFLPIFVRLGTFAVNLKKIRQSKPAAAGGNSARSLGSGSLDGIASPLRETIEAIVETVAMHTDLSERIKNLMVRKIASKDRSGCILLLDGLDEVPRLRDEDTSPDYKGEVRDAIRAIAEQTDCQIILTSRIVGYGGEPFPLNNRTARELELVAFEWKQTEQFIRAWFQDAQNKASALLRKLRQEPIMRSLTGVPLLLSFICLVSFEHGNSTTILPTRRAELYKEVLSRLLKGEWRSGEREPDRGVPRLPNTTRDDRVEAKRRVLQEVAWHFAAHEDQFRDYMPRDELREQILNCSETELLKGKMKLLKDTSLPARMAPEEPDGKKRFEWDLLEELSDEDGILIHAGDPEDSEVPYMFLHRSLHEYLVARYLSEQKKDMWLPHVRQHFWFDPDWEEVIVLLAGVLNDPTPLLSALLEEENDAFHAMLLLAGRCLAEVDPVLIEGKQKT
jgi:hypothetical protein